MGREQALTWYHPISPGIQRIQGSFLPNGRQSDNAGMRRSLATGSLLPLLESDSSRTIFRRRRAPVSSSPGSLWQPAFSYLSLRRKYAIFAVGLNIPDRAVECQAACRTGRTNAGDALSQGRAGFLLRRALLGRNGIDAARMKGMAFAYPSDGQPRSFDGPVRFQRFERIGGAGRIKPAGGRFQRRNEFAVKHDRSLHSPAHHSIPTSLVRK